MVTHRNVAHTETFESQSPNPSSDQARLASDQWMGYPQQRPASERTGGGGPTDQGQGAAPDLPHSYQQVFGHLQNAERAVETQGLRAALPEYYAAIQAADSIDQNAVNQEAALVSRQLQQGGLDAQTQRQLQQEMMNLQALHRAPGIARANLGLLLVRNGMNSDGVNLLMEAAQHDPMMSQDPNFQRHFQSALQAGAQIAQQQGGATPDAGQRAAQGTPQDGGGGGNGLDAAALRNQGQVTDQQQQQQQLSPTFQGLTPYQAAQALAAKVTGPITDQAQLQGLADNFAQVVAAADQGISPRAAGAQRDWQTALAQLKTDYAPKQQDVTAIDQQLVAAIQQANLSPDNLAKAKLIYSRLGQAANLKEYQTLENQLAGLVPGTVQIMNRRNRILGDDFLKEMFNCNQLKDNFEAEQNQSAMTRFQFAKALAKAGDAQDAKKMMAEAIVHNTSKDLQPLLADQAAAMGVTQADVTAAQQTMQRVAATSPGSTDGTAPSRRPVGAGSATDTQQGPAQGPAQVSSDKIGTSDDPAMAQLDAAVAAFNQPGDAKKGLPAADAQFQQAVALADSELASLPTLAQVQAQIEKVFPADQQAKYKALETNIAQAVAGLSAQDQATWKNIDNGKVDQQSAQQWLAAHPQMLQLLQQENDLTKNVAPLLQQELQIKNAMDNRMLAHLRYAQALQLAGDPRAKDVFVKGFAGVPKELQQNYLQKDEVSKLAQALGVLAGGPANTGDGSTSTNPGGAAGRTSDSQIGTNPGGTPGGGTAGGDNAQAPPGMIKSADDTFFKPTGDANVDKLAQTQTYKSLMKQAELNVNQGVDAATPYYKAACAVADSLDPNQLQKRLQSDLDAVKNPQTSVADKKNAYTDAITAMMVIAPAATLAHEEYAQKLLGFHRYDDAKNQFDLAIQSSDKMPVAQMQQLYQQMNQDLNNQQLPADFRADLNTVLPQVQSMVQSPIAIREEVAQFYLAGGKNPNGSPIGTKMMVGYNATTKQPLTTDFDTKILNPEKAAALTQQAADLQMKINGVDINKTPDLDPSLAGLRAAVLFNAPDNLKKQLEHSGHLWANSASTFTSTAVGLATTLGALYLTAKGDEGAFGQLTALRVALTGAAGLGTATLSNYGMEKGVFGREDWSMWDSAKLGGGSFLAAGGMLLTRNAGLNYKLGQIGESGVANETMLQGMAKLTSKSAQLGGDAGQTALPGLESLAAGSNRAVSLGDVAMRFEGATPEVQNSLQRVAELYTSKGMSSVKLGDAVKLAEQAGDAKQLALLQNVQESLGTGDVTLSRAADLVKGKSYKMSDGLSSLIKKYGSDKSLAEVINNPEFLKLKDAAWVADNPAEAKALQAEATAVKNMLGTTNVQRASALYHLMPKEVRGVQLVGDAAAQSSRLSRAANSIGQVFKPLQAGRVPTFMEYKTATVGVGSIAGLTYNVGSTYFNAGNAYDKGDSTESAAKVLADSFKFTGDFHGINPGNIVIQSLLTGLMLGNVKAAAPLVRSPMATWGLARGANPGIFGLGKAAVSTGWQGVEGLGRASLSFLNPAENATASQVLRQSLFLPAAYYTGPALYLGHSASSAAEKPWQDALDNLSRPIQNDTNYAPPMLDPRTGEVVESDDSAHRQQKQGQSGEADNSAQQQQQQQRQAGNGSAGAGDVDTSQMDPNIAGNIQ